MPGYWPNSKTLYLVLSLLALGCYGTVFYLWQLNAPFQDDLSDILGFVWQFDSSHSLAQRWQLLLEPQNTHRTAASRLLYLATFKLHGSVDFALLSMLGSITLLVLALVYSLALFNSGNKALSFALVVLFLFSLRPYSLVHWPMTSFHYYFLLLYSALCLLALQQPGASRFCLALLAATAATFTSSGGQVLWLLGGMFLLYQRFSHGPVSNLQLLAWAVIGWLLVDYAYLGFAVEILFPQVEEAGLVHFLHCWLVLVGSAVSFGSTQLGLVTGLVVLALCGLIMLRDIRSGLQAAHFYLLFLLALAAAISYGRSDYMHIDYALRARYSFVSVHLLACTALLALGPGRGRPGQLSASSATALVTAAIVFYLSSYAYYGPAYEKRMNRRIKAFNSDNYHVPFRAEAEVRKLVEGAIDAGVYVPPAKPVRQHFVFTAPAQQ